MMKRVRIVRRTPLRQRKMYRPPARKEETKVTPQMHAYILNRDKMCFAARVEPEHRCRDRWGNPHAADALNRLTLDHVHEHAMMGVRAKSIRGRMVAACGWANNEGWCSAHRNEEREYLRLVEPDGQ